MKKRKISVKSNKRIGIVYRKATAEALKLAKEVARWLLDQDHRVYSPAAKTLGSRVFNLTRGKSMDQLDLVIVFGGDGTYLEAARMLDGRPIPILGINMGSLGFLTETRLQDAYIAIANTLEEKVDLRPRSILKITVRRSGKVRKSYLALNEAVIERGAETHLLSLAIYLQKQLVCELKADGIVLATPTGSTAYNLAAGGPILHPEVGAFVLTPISSHSLTMRPMLFPDNQKLSIKSLPKNQKARLTIDGQPCEEITCKDEVIIQRNNKDHFVVREPSHNYFNLLRDKLKFGQRA